MSHSDGADTEPTTINLSSSDWRRRLTSKQFDILRSGGTEPPNSHSYVHFFPKMGFFVCAGCNLPLYSSSAKMQDSGWPAWDKCFYSDVQGSHVSAKATWAGTEVTCSRCKGHLGHVFYGERRTRTNERH
uniref:MsrB domain-containing protein n=1 Tax=Noctiluca scintillans TaxID=2966 RepID=A0A7S1AQ48_NOCSC